MSFHSNKKIILITVVSILMISGLVSAQDGIVDLEFKQPTASDSDASRTLHSLVKVQGTGIFTQDGLYLMTHYGDREEMFERENQGLIDNPLINQTWRHCSVFSISSENSVIFGRNWDNQNVGSIIVSLYKPPGQYSSICFSRSIDVGFGHKDLEQYASSMFGEKLLLAPFYATDGVNEHGLAVACASVDLMTVGPQSGKRLICITLLMRKILDQAKTVLEAEELVEQYVPFDIDQNSLTTHLIVADSSGRSVILEYDSDQWTRTYPVDSWQILTTKPVYDVSQAHLRESCWRYESIYQSLRAAGEDLRRDAGMKILQDVAQKGTAWSAVYSLPTKEVHFSVYQNWNTVYHLRIP